MDTANQVLASKGLDILAMALDGPYDTAVVAIISDIRETLGMDISNVNCLNCLSEEQIGALKEYENAHTQELLVIVVRRKNSTPLSSGPGGCTNCNLNPSSPSRPNSVFLQNFGAAMVLLTFAYIFFITWFPIPEKNQRFVDIVLGALMCSIVPTVINFFFGSSIKKSDLRKQVADEEIPLPGEEK